VADPEKNNLMHKFIDKYSKLVEEKEHASRVQPCLGEVEELQEEEKVDKAHLHKPVIHKPKPAHNDSRTPQKPVETVQTKPNNKVQKRPTVPAEEEHKLHNHNEKAVSPYVNPLQEESYNILETIHASQNKQRLQKQTNYIIDDADDTNPTFQQCDSIGEDKEHQKTRDKFSQSVIIPAATSSFPSSTLQANKAAAVS